MTAHALIEQVRSDGLELRADGGKLKLSGPVEVVERWKLRIVASKPEIMAALAPIPPDLEHLIRRAGTYWEYSPDDYELVRNLARRDPDGLRRALESDKWLAMAEQEAFEERAAIMEYDGGLSREEAERRATLPINTREYGREA